MKVVIAPLAEKNARKIKFGETNVRRAKGGGPLGGPGTLYTVDFASATIDRDLTWVFGQNVARARAENKRVLGTPDGVSKK